MDLNSVLSAVTIAGLVLNFINQNRISKKDLIAPVKESLDDLKDSFNDYCKENKQDFNRVYDHISRETEVIEEKSADKIAALRSDFTKCQLTHASINNNGVKN